MVSWPDLGTRVTVRYRRRPGSVPPLTDAVGHLLAVDPVVRVRTKTGAVVEYRCDTIEALLEAGEKFDVVLAMEVIEHVSDPAAFATPGSPATQALPTTSPVPATDIPTTQPTGAAR